MEAGKSPQVLLNDARRDLEARYPSALLHFNDGSPRNPFIDLWKPVTSDQRTRVSYLPMFHIIVTAPSASETGHPEKRNTLMFTLMSFNGKSIKHQRLHLERGEGAENRPPQFVDDLMNDNLGLCCGLATIPDNPRKDFLYEHFGDFRVYRAADCTFVIQRPRGKKGEEFPRRCIDCIKMAKPKKASKNDEDEPRKLPGVQIFPKKSERS